MKNFLMTMIDYGNVDWLDFNYDFNYAYVNGKSGWKEFEIVKWRNFEDGDMVQFETKLGNVVLGHSTTIILAKNRINFD